MTKLNQIIALANGTKGRTQQVITVLHRRMGHAPGMQGLSRSYTPRDEDGERLPSEVKIVQEKAVGVLQEALTEWEGLWELVLTQDIANTVARADICVDGFTLAQDVPVTTMLWLAKQLDDMYTFAKGIPVVDPASEWHYSEQVDCYATKPSETIRTKKIPRNHVKSEATKEHPAQVDVYPEDVVVGTWSKIDYSGAMLAQDKAELLNRIEALQDAVRVAKEAANDLAVDREKRLADLFKYIAG